MKKHNPLLSRSSSLSIAHRGFTLIEILITVTILGIVSAITVPQFSNAATDSAINSTLSQTQALRGQIEIFRVQENREPDLLNSQWDELVANDYLADAPRNPANGSSVVANAPGANVGWVWRDKGNGTFMLYPTDVTFLAELVE